MTGRAFVFSLNRYAHEQTAIVKKYKGDHQLLTTNVSGGFFDKWFDHEENLEVMDFVSYDNYPVWGGQTEPITPAHIALGHDFNRGLLHKNFWIVEELMGAQGHDIIGYLPRPNQENVVLSGVCSWMYEYAVFPLARNDKRSRAVLLWSCRSR